MRICFFGTPDFALPSLRALVEDPRHEVIAVFTQPDKPAGRKKIMTPPPVKVEAESFRIPVHQPEKIRETQWVEKLKELRPDLFVTAAFGQILSQEVLDIPTYGTVNVHGSLLPKYRGPAPIQWAIINGEKVSGVTTMLTDAGIDTGDMLLKREVGIGEQETAGELFDRLSEVGAELLIETLERLQEITPVPQNEDESSYFPMIDKGMAKIDFSESCQSIVNLVRGMNPWPVAWFENAEKQIKIYKAKCHESLSGQPGQVLEWSAKHGIVVACGQGAVRFDILQAPGKKAMDAAAFANGFQIAPGTIL